MIDALRLPTGTFIRAAYEAIKSRYIDNPLTGPQALGVGVSAVQDKIETGDTPKRLHITTIGLLTSN